VYTNVGAKQQWILILKNCSLESCKTARVGGQREKEREMLAALIGPSSMLSHILYQQQQQQRRRRTYSNDHTRLH
jgi:hypothetical protein